MANSAHHKTPAKKAPAKKPAAKGKRPDFLTPGDTGDTGRPAMARKPVGKVPPQFLRGK